MRLKHVLVAIVQCVAYNSHVCSLVKEEVITFHNNNGAAGQVAQFLANVLKVIIEGDVSVHSNLLRLRCCFGQANTISKKLRWK